MTLWDFYLLTICLHMSAHILCIFMDKDLEFTSSSHLFFVGLIPVLNVISTYRLLQEILEEDLWKR